MSNKLKPCPFCGGEAFFREIVEYGVKAVCKNCWNESKFYHDEIDAIIAWNSRIRPTFTPDEIDIIARYMRQDFDGNGALERAILKKCAAALKGGAQDD